MRSIFKSIFIIGILFTGRSLIEAQKTCREGPLDIFFILETSLDTGRSGFSHLTTFVQKVAKNIGIDHDSNRISITFFNKQILDILDLKESKSIQNLQDLMERTKYWSGGNRATNVGKAMEFIADVKFSDLEDRGRRPEVPAVCVIVIEGVASDKSEEAAFKLRKHCRIIVLGINRPNYFELSRIVSEPTMGHLKTMQTYLDLVRFDKWTGDTICKPPVSKMQLQRGRITESSIQIVWDEQPFAAQYRLHLRLSGGRKPLQEITIPASQNNVTFMGLKEGTRYSFDTWAIDSDGNAGPKSVIFLSSGIQVPEMKMDPASVTKTSVVVRWTLARKHGVTYYITVKKADSGEFVTATSVPGNSHKITGLMPGTSYTIELVVIFKGERSESDRRLTVNTVPDPPQPSTVYITDRAVKLEWKPVKGAAVYGIRTYDTETSTGIELLVRVDESNETSFIVEPLLSGKKYRFALTSKTSAGIESEESSPIIERIAPSNPRAIHLVSRTTRNINITWDKQDGVSTYLVQFKAFNSPDLLSRLVNTNWFNAEALGIGTVYLFNVFSMGENSKYDTENPATITIQTIPPKVDGVLIQKITQNSVTLQWNRARGAREYLLEFHNAKTNELLRTETVKGNEIEIDGLLTGISYLMTVSAVGTDGVKGQASVPQMIITLPSPPGKPSLIGKTNSSLTFKWDRVTGAIQYMMEIQELGSVGPKQFRTTRNSYTFDNLKSGTWYDVRLRSIGSGGRINMKQSEKAGGRTMPRIPDKPRIIVVTAMSVTIAWDTVKGAVGYIVNIRLDGQDEMLETRNSTENEYKIVNLRGGESYYAAVKAYAEGGRETEESEWTLVETMPEAPKKPRVLSVSSSTVTLEWDKVKGASEYVISISDMRRLTEVRTKSTNYQIEGLTPSTRYSFGLFSVAIEGTRNEKESERVLAITAPRPPDDVRLRDVGMTYVEIAWIPVRGAVSYMIRYRSIRDDEGLENGEMKTDNPHSIFQTISGLTAGVIYEFRVYAVGQDGSESDPGILIDGTLPATPNAPLILLVSSTNATLSWNPAKGAESYILVARAKGFEKEVTSSTTRVDIDGLKAGTKYEFTVMSVGISGRVNRYESRKTREQTLTSTPTNVAIGVVTTTEISLSWDKMTGALYYSVALEYAEQGRIPRKFMAFSTSYKIRRLEPGTAHRIKVASVGSNFIESDYSEMMTIATVPESPQPPQIIEVTNKSVELKWEAVKGAVKYTVGAKEGGGDDVTEVNTTESEVVISDLEAGVWYEYVVSSIGAGDRRNEVPSGSVRVQTVPAIPTNFTATDTTTSSVTVEWDEVTGSNMYKVYVRQQGVNIANQTTRETGAIIWNLKPGIVYSFTVETKGEGQRDSAESPPIFESTDTEVPEKAKLTDISSDTAALQWTEIPGAVKYRVYYENLETRKQNRKETEEPKIFLSGLAAGTWYYFSVSSIGAGGKESLKSDVLEEQTVPETPTNVQVKNVGVDFINIVWDESKGASSYKAVCTFHNEVNEITKKIIKTEETKATFSDLSPGTDYNITIESLGQSKRKSRPSDPLKENTIPVTPKTPTVESVEPSMFKITWEEVKGASSYVVEIIPEIGRKIYRETQKSSWMEQRIEPGKWFKVNVQSKDKKNRGNGVATENIEIQTICLQPSNVKMPQIGTKSVRFDWDEMQGADFYLVTIIWSIRDEILNPFGGQETDEDETIAWEGRIGKKKIGLRASKLEQYSIKPSEVVVKGERAWFRIQTRTNKIEVVGLEAATSYDFEFETVNEQGRTSMRKTYLNETTLPNKVSLITLIDVTESTALLAWDAVKGTSRYVVNVTRQLNGVMKTFSTPESTILLDELFPGSWYEAQVFTVGRNGNMNFEGSEELSFETTPAQSKEVRILNVTTTTIAISWQNNEGAAYYKIIIRLAQPFNELLRIDESRENQHVVEDLTPGTKYVLSVIAVASGGREGTPSSRTVDTTVPAKPENLRLMDISTTTANLQWDGVDGTTAYIISIRGDDNAERQMRTKGTVITIENLNPGVWYEFWVQSVGVKNRVNVEESNIVRQQTVPRSPERVNVEEVTTTTMSLSWRKVHGIKQFQIFVEDEDGIQQVYNVTRSFYTLSQLIPGATYNIFVVAIGTSGQASQKSETVVVSTVPPSTTELTVTGVSTTHVELGWTAVTGASEYIVVMRDPVSGRILKRFDSKQPSLVITPLKPGTNYLFSVIGKGKNGKESGESPQIRVQTTPLSPTAVRSGTVTTTTIDVKWKPVPGVKLYKVIIKEHGSDEVWRVDEVQKTEHMVAGLKSGAMYSVGVVTVGTSGRESDISEVITEATYPDRPSDLEITKFTTTSMDLQWDPVFGALHYIVNVNGDGKTDKEIIVHESKISIPALLPGNWYEVFVTAVGEMQRKSEPSDTMREQTEPLAPSKLLITKTRTTSISLQWEPVGGVKFYEIEVTSSTEGRNDTKQTFVSVETDYTVTDLIPGTAHTIVVVGVASSGRKSQPSEPLQQTTVPAALEEVVIVDATTTSVTLRWLKITGASIYTIIIRSSTDRSGAIMRAVDTTSSTFKVDALVPGETYYFSIRSKGFGGKLSKESPRVQAQTVSLPPAGVKVTNVRTREITLTWKPSNGAECYRVFVENQSGELLKTFDVKEENEHTVDGLTAGTVYSFSVSAIGRTGRESAKSSSVSQITKPLGPTGVRVENVQTSTITLTWNPVAGIRRYKISVKNVDSDEEFTMETISTRFVIDELPAGVHFSMTVFSIGIDGQESAPSITVAEQTVPSAPENVAITDITETSMTVTWNKVIGVVEYIVVIKERSSGLETRHETNRNKITIEDLSPGTEYEVSVLSVGEKERTNNKPSKVLVEQTVSSAVQGLRIVSSNTRSLKLAWNRAPGVTRYVVRVRDHGNGLLVETLETTELDITVENLFPGKNYSFAVVGVAINGKMSEESEPVIASTGLPAPPQPAVQVVTNSSITLVWEEVQGAREYIVTVTAVESGVITRFTVEEEYFLAEDLMPGSSYSFSLIAIGASGETSEEGEKATIDTIPSTPSMVKASSVETNSITLSWKKVKGAVHYIVIARWQRVGVRRVQVINETTTDVIHHLELPQPGTEYGITVSAVGKNGASSPSEELTENSLPDTPSVPWTRDVTTTSITLAWQRVLGAASYEIVISDETTETAISTIEYRPSSQLNNLQPGEWYNIRIFSRDIQQRSNKKGSRPLRVQTVPNAPTNFRSTKVTIESITMAWEAAKGAFTYEVTVKAREDDIISFNKDWKNVKILDRKVSFTINTEERSVTVEGLKPGSNYQVEVRSVGDEERKSEAVTALAKTLPGTVSDVSVKKVSTNSVTLEWSDVEEASFYQVTLIRGQRQSPIITVVQQPSVTLTQLLSGSWYTVSVITFDIRNGSSLIKSEPLRFQTVPSQIRDVQTTDVTTNSMVITWNTVQGAESFQVKFLWRPEDVSPDHLRREGPLDRSGMAQRTFNTRSTSVNVIQLDPGTMYWLEVTSLSEEGRRSAPSQRRNETTLPSGIAEITVNSVTETTVSLSWEEIKGAQKYDVVVTSIDDFRPPIKRVARRPQIVVKSLLPGRTYKFVVQALGEKERRAEIESATINIKTLPAAPTDVQVVNVTSGSIAVSWTAPKGAARYEVFIEHRDENRQQQEFSFKTRNTVIDISELQPGIKYSIYVVAFGDQQDSSASARSQTISQRTMLSTPLNLQIDGFGEDYVSLSWDHSKGASSYMVYSTNTETGKVVPMEFSDVSQSNDVTNLDSGVVYSFTVRAISSEDNMMSEQSEAIQQRTKPSPPRFIRVIDVGSNYLTVQWVAVAGANSYTIFVTEKGFTEKRIGNHKNESITIRKLKPGSEYRIQVTAVTVEGISSRKSARVSQATAPNAPGNPTVKFFTTTSIEIEWASMKGASLYIVTVMNEETGENYEADAGSALSLEVVDLEPGTNYSFTVRGEDTGRKLRSDESRKLYQSTYPEAPKVEVVSFNPFSISLSWNAVKGADHYSIFIRFVDGNDQPQEIKNIKLTNHTIKDLEPGSEYEMQVIAISSDGLRSDRSLKVLQFTSPNTPTGLDLQNATEATMMLTWVPAKGATQYRIILINMETKQRSTVTTQGDPIHLFTRLKPGTLYSAHAYAVTLPDFTRSDKSVTVLLRTAPSPPQNLIVFDVKEDSVSLEWRPSRGADSYTVFINKVGDHGTLERQVKNVKRPQVTVQRLSSGSVYSFEVAAVTEFGNVGKRSKAVTQQTVPAPPQDIVISEVTSTSLRVNWTKSEGATSYSLKLVDQDTKELRQRNVGNSKTVRFNRLNPGTMYRLTMVAKRQDADVMSRNSYGVSQRTLPVEPTDLTVYSVTSSSIGLEWKASKGASTHSIIIYELDKTGFPADDGAAINGISETYVDIIELDPGVDYLFEVYSVTEEKQWSAEAASVIQATKYRAPVLPSTDEPLVYLSEATSTTMLAEWRKVTHASTYILVIRSESEEDSFISDINGTSAKISDLSPNTEYSITLIAVGRSGDETVESSPPAVLKTHPRPPAPPSGFSTSSFTNDSVSLEWRPAPRAISYEIEMTDMETRKKSVITDISEPRYDVKGLVPGRRYSFRVIAVGLYERSALSVNLVTGAQHPVPVMPLSKTPLVRATNVKWNSMIVILQRIPDAVSYTLIMRKDGKLFREIPNLPRLRHQLSGLSEFTTYELTYFAVGAGGDASDESDPPLVVTTLPNTPEVPTGVGASDMSGETVVLEWDDAKRAVAYDVIITDIKTGIPLFYQNVSSPYIADGLVFDTTYSVTVTSIGKYDKSAASKEIEFKTRVPKPGFIRVLVVKDITESEIMLLWSPATYAVSYTITVRENGKIVQEMKEILGNSIRIKELKSATTYEVGVKAVGLQKDEGEEKSESVTTLEGTDVPEVIVKTNEFGIDEDELDNKEDESSEITVPTTLEEALSVLVSTMVKMPKDEIQKETSGKVIVKKNSVYRVSLWKYIETVRRILLSSPTDREERKSTISSQPKESNGADESVEKLLILSETLTNDPKSFGNSGAKKIAFEIAGLLMEIYALSPEFEELEASGHEDYQELMTPILEDLLLGVILGELQIKVTVVYPKSIVLTPSGKVPSKFINLKIRKTGSSSFLKTVKVTQETKNVRFGDLEPGTEYEIFAVTKDQDVIISKTVTTKSPFATKPPVPAGLRVAFTARSYVSVRWRPVRRGTSVITYIVRLYRPNSKKLVQKFKMQRATTKIITKLKSRTSYDVTVSSYDLKVKKQSNESGRLRIRTR